jgi:hypothetical protein
MSKTIYILAGGSDLSHPDYWDDLRKALHPNEGTRLLSCMFSRDPDRWEDLFSRFKPHFLKAFGESTDLKLADIENFNQQAEWADVIYLHGGDLDMLRQNLPKPEALLKLFSGKIIIGSSAGAQLLSAQCWRCSKRRVDTGLGFTPLNVLVHYKSDFGSDDPRGPIDWSRARAELQEAVGTAEVACIREGQFVKH